MSAYSKLLRDAEKRLDAIVQMAEQCIQKGGRLPEESQLRNLLNLATETHSVAVLENYIRYQAARSGEPIPARFGGQVLKDIAELSRWAKEIATEGKVDPEGSDGRRLRMHLIRMYLGFLARSAVAANSK